MAPSMTPTYGVVPGGALRQVRQYGSNPSLIRSSSAPVYLGPLFADSVAIYPLII